MGRHGDATGVGLTLLVHDEPRSKQTTLQAVEGVHPCTITTPERLGCILGDVPRSGVAVSTRQVTGDALPMVALVLGRLHRRYERQPSVRTT